MAYAPDRDAYARALAKLRPVLRVVTMPAELTEDPCAGTYLCDCKRCVHQRAVLMHRGARDKPQPWQPRRAA